MTSNRTPNRPPNRTTTTRIWTFLFYFYAVFALAAWVGIAATWLAPDQLTHPITVWDWAAAILLTFAAACSWWNRGDRS